MGEAFLCETFTGASLDPRLRWFCEPAQWSLNPSMPALIVETGADTDFWQRTHYGFQADNGHFLYADVSGDFVLSTRVRAHPSNQYDQAGLMIRLSPDCWLKTSVEYEPDAPAQLGAVVTNGGYSDWSVQDYLAPQIDLNLRVTRSGADCVVEYSPDGAVWRLLRVAHLTAGEVACGVYACSPKGAGLIAEFSHLTIERG
jgi:uncharacterized protein